MLWDYQLFIHYSRIHTKKYLLRHLLCSGHCSKCWRYSSEQHLCPLPRTIRDTRTPLLSGFFFFFLVRHRPQSLASMSWHTIWETKLTPLKLGKQLSAQAWDGSPMYNPTSIFYFPQIAPHSRCRNHFSPPFSSPQTHSLRTAMLPGLRRDPHLTVL